MVGRVAPAWEIHRARLVLVHLLARLKRLTGLTSLTALTRHYGLSRLNRLSKRIARLLIRVRLQRIWSW